MRLRERGLFERAVVGERDFFLRHADDRRVDVVKCFFVNAADDLGADAVGFPTFFDDDGALSYLLRLGYNADDASLVFASW